MRAAITSTVVPPEFLRTALEAERRGSFSEKLSAVSIVLLTNQSLYRIAPKDILKKRRLAGRKVLSVRRDILLSAIRDDRVRTSAARDAGRRRQIEMDRDISRGRRSVRSGRTSFCF
jgi:hypothetical protein